MIIYGDNLSKLLSLKEILIRDKELNLIKMADMDITNIQNFITKELILTTIVERENGDFENLYIDNESDFIQRIESKELVRLGTIYFLLLTIDLKKVVETKRDYITFVVNAMRNRSYEKLKLLMRILLNQNFVSRLNLYIVENEGDKDNVVRLILLKLSQYINNNEVNFETEEDLELFIDQYIKSEVNTRIGDPTDNIHSKSFHN